MRCRAVRDGDHYVLSGTKYWITNAGVSDIYTVFAKTDPDGGSRGISCFMVEADWGVKVAKLEKKMGMRGSPTGEIVFDDVRVPVENRIGEEGDGFKIAMHTLDRSRPTIGAQAVGIAQGAIDAASRLHARDARRSDSTIANFQGLRFMIADMAMRTEAAADLVYRACSVIDAGDPDGELSMIGAMAKCFASDTAMSVTTDAVQLFGGYGYTHGLPGGAVHARRQGHPDLRGHQPDPASRDLEAVVGLTSVTDGVRQLQQHLLHQSHQTLVQLSITINFPGIGDTSVYICHTQVSRNTKNESRWPRSHSSRPLNPVPREFSEEFREFREFSRVPRVPFTITPPTS